MGPEILAKTSKNMQVWFGKPDFGTFSLISRDPVRIFQNRFFCCNLELKPVVLSTMYLINRMIFFVINEAINMKGGQNQHFPAR